MAARSASPRRGSAAMRRASAAWPGPWLWLCACAAVLSGVQGHVVSVAEGDLRGEDVAGLGGARDYIAFRGVPYAKPPVGALRFKAPEPFPRWQGIRNATVEGNKCPQLYNGEPIGDEDCLIVNVYTPSLSCPPAGYAVIVFVHGGALIDGSPSIAPFFGPDFLVDRDVVLVLPGYRLGALGFLNLDTDAVPGNAGLKDVVAALRWVRDNVAAFCGDPAKVTLMGQSAGSKLVSYVSVTEAGRGLFRAAVQLSGVAISPMVYTEAHVERAHALAALLPGGSADMDTAAVESALVAADWRNIIRASLEMRDGTPWGVGYNWFVPSPERRPSASVLTATANGPVDANGQPVALTRDPESLFRDGLVPRVPTITSTVSREGLTFGKTVLENTDSLANLIANMTAMLRVEFLQLGVATAQAHGVPAAIDDDLALEVVRRVKDKYFQGGDPTTKYPEAMANLLGDMRYTYPLYRFVKVLDKQDAPLYLYLFDVDDEFNFERRGVRTHVPGSAHADDLGYLFRVTKMTLNQNISGNSSADRVLRAHTKLVTDFAKTLSVPDGMLDVAAGSAVRRSNPPFLYIGKSFRETRVEDTLGARDRIEFWDSIMNMMLDPGRASSSAAAATASTAAAAAVALFLLMLPR